MTKLRSISFLLAWLLLPMTVVAASYGPTPLEQRMLSHVRFAIAMIVGSRKVKDLDHYAIQIERQPNTWFIDYIKRKGYRGKDCKNPINEISGCIRGVNAGHTILFVLYDPFVVHEWNLDRYFAGFNGGFAPACAYNSTYFYALLAHEYLHEWYGENESLYEIERKAKIFLNSYHPAKMDGMAFDTKFNGIDCKAYQAIVTILNG
jgi:hypothetical protein